jgi:hypothetical protein
MIVKASHIPPLQKLIPQADLEICPARGQNSYAVRQLIGDLDQKVTANVGEVRLDGLDQAPWEP